MSEALLVAQVSATATIATAIHGVDR